MSVVLHPGNHFTVVRQIANHLDTDTNYVRAVIRNAYTDAIIDTLDLEDKGGQRFKKNWLIPQDPSGQGFYVSIVTSVYTDSGYTTKNANYGDEEDTYLVQDRVLHRGGGGVDAYTVRKIIQDAIASIPSPEPISIPEPKEPVDRTDELLTAIGSIKTAMPKPPTIPKTDLTPVLTAIDGVRQAVADKEITPEADLMPVLQSIQHFQGVVTELLKHLGDILVPAVKQAIANEMTNVQWTSSFTTSAAKGETPPAQREPVPTPEPLDVTKLAA